MKNDNEQLVETMSKEGLIKLLKHITALVENDDSFSGYIGYERIDKKVIVLNDDRGDYEVKCIFRSGNSEGEGFMTFIPDIVSSKDKNDG
jgi:hypothetical protein